MIIIRSLFNKQGIINRIEIVKKFYYKILYIILLIHNYNILKLILMCTERLIHTDLPN